MPWREVVQPVRMQRIALVAPAVGLREVLVLVADEGTVEVDCGAGTEGAPATPSRSGPAGEPAGEAGRRLRDLRTEPLPAARLAPTRPDPDVLVRTDRLDLLAGEAEVESCAAAAVVRDEVAGLAGWAPTDAVPSLRSRLAPAGGALVPLPTPRGVDPPTMLRPGGGVRRSFTPLVDTYATVPYADVDPTMLAGLAYVVMFGMMFGDVGHGALLVLAGLMLRAGRPAGLARWRTVWPFVVGAGLTAMGFGALYGEFFGPTGVVPVLWLSPLEHPVTLLLVALGVGAVLLAGAYTVGAVNRYREGGWPLALSTPSGLAGASLFAGAGLVLLGVQAHLAWAVATGALVALGGAGLVFLGFVATAGAEGSGRGSALAQAVVELFDAVLRLGANLVSFARLAAFGLTHAAIGLVVWEATTGLWRGGGLLIVLAGVTFVVGNALAFALEALVAGVQALRLEYYELFSRVFAGEGRPFRPWHLPLDPSYHREGAA